MKIINIFSSFLLAFFALTSTACIKSVVPEVPQLTPEEEAFNAQCEASNGTMDVTISGDNWGQVCATGSSFFSFGESESFLIVGYTNAGVSTNVEDFETIYIIGSIIEADGNTETSLGINYIDGLYGGFGFGGVPGNIEWTGKIYGMQSEENSENTNISRNGNTLSGSFTEVLVDSENEMETIIVSGSFSFELE